MRTPLTCLALVALCSHPADSACAQEDGEARPCNIVLILSDDAGYTDFGFQGSTEFPSPNLDELCQGGVRFTQAYVSASVCSPSRAGLLTGRHQQRFGHEFNLPRVQKEEYSAGRSGLSVDEQTLADRLKSAGYRTGIVGKWHLGIAEHFQPLQRGFDEFFGFLFGSRSYHPISGGTGVGMRLRDADAGGETVAEEAGYLTDRLAAEACKFIERHAAEPFFVFVSFNAVHTPLHSLEEDLAQFPQMEEGDRRHLAAMTLALDRSVGSIMDCLKVHELEERTLVVFLNDNGGAESNSSDNPSACPPP